MMPSVIIRCDGGTHIGMGHVVRCLALANMLREYFEVSFVLQETEGSVYEWITQQGFHYTTLSRTNDYESDCTHLIEALNNKDANTHVVVLDGYHFTTTYQQRLHQHGCKVVVIDDLNSWHHTADAIINHAPDVSPTSYDCEEHTRLLLGLDYALLRPEILNASSTALVVNQAERFLISMGAADESNRTEFFARLLVTHFPKARVQLLMSSLNPHYDAITALTEIHPQLTICLNLNTRELTDALMHTDVVICPASTISIEACAMGCSLITGYTAPNQLGILNGLTHHGAAISLGAFQSLTEAEALDCIRNFTEDITARTEQLKHQRTLIDGKSGRRLALSFLEIAYACTVREATTDDAQLYFEWANDPAVRANSYQTADIGWDDHVRWFEAASVSPNTRMWIYSIDRTPAAQMRLKLENEKAIINYSVSASYRGRGLSKLLLQHAALKVSLEKVHVKCLEGWVKKSNLASYRAFERSGYRIVEETDNSVLFQRSVNG
jgi:UDP-2,4-diacetamido-2,4,6-trideoxy-beta-L-altropyranose hydrolase